MEECFKCGVSSVRARLFDAISDEGIVKICEKCSFEEHMPIIRRPTTFQLKESERKQTVYEKLSRAAGIKTPEATDSSFSKSKEEVTLREIVDRKYQENLPKESAPRPEMINNFHWIIMRARRMKKLTQAQFAKEIEESEAAIKMAEQGILPEDDYRLVNKLENYLGIKIIRPEFVEKIRETEKPKELSFDLQTSKELTIADLKEIKEEREFEVLGQEVEELDLIGEDVEEIKLEDIGEEEIKRDKGEVSQEEMDKILFGR